ncbi:MAG: DUF1643 domain-containing protein [Mangrovibacterium sp.]
MNNQLELFETYNTGAIFSDDRKYRFALWRKWDQNKPLVMFIGLNPSTANETDPDPTIRRVTNFAKSWGYGGFYMMNLFAYVTPYPQELIISDEHIQRNDHMLEHIAAQCKKIIFAWGSFKEAKDRAKGVSEKFNGYALKINKDGSPMHPLYVPANTEPVLFQSL